MRLNKHWFPVCALLLTVALMFVQCGDSDEPTEPTDPLAGAALCLSDSSCALVAMCDTSNAIDVMNCGSSAILSWSVADDAPWLSLSCTSGETPGQLCLMADSNRSGAERLATVTVTANDLADESIDITVTQPSVEPTLCVSLAEWEASSLGDESEWIVVTNCGDLTTFLFMVTTDEDWLELPLTCCNTPWAFTIVADANNSGEDRTGTVTVTAEGVAGSPWEITVEQPSAVALIGSYDTPGYAWGVFVSGNYAYVADGASGLEVIDVSDPSNPVLTGSYDTPGTSRGVFVLGNYAYVADGSSSGLQVIDISNPSNPTLAGSCWDYWMACPAAVFVSGNYAYMADWENALHTIDISDPYNPVYLVRCGMWNSSDVFVSGDYAYLAATDPLEIYDISDPSAPVLAGIYSTPLMAFSVFVSGDYAYVGDVRAGRSDGALLIVDVSDPVDPALVGSCVTSGPPYGVYASGNYALGACDESGLLIFDVTNREDPEQVADYDTPGSARDVFVSGGYIYVADYGSGLLIFELQL